MQSPALYYHFKDKQELLGQMAAAMVAECYAVALKEAGANAEWDVWLCTYAQVMRRTLLHYRDGARVLTTQSPTGQMKTQHTPAMTQPLIAAGFSKELAVEAGASVAAFMLGWVSNEQNPAIHAFMASLLDLDLAFEHGVEALVAGFRVKFAALNKTRSRRTQRSLATRRHRVRSS